MKKKISFAFLSLHFILTLLNIRSMNIFTALSVLPYLVGFWSQIKATLILESFLMSSSHPALPVQTVTEGNF